MWHWLATMKATINWKLLVAEMTVERGGAKGGTAWGERGWANVWSAEKIENYSTVNFVSRQ
jgi:hypothetical protein